MSPQISKPSIKQGSMNSIHSLPRRSVNNVLSSSAEISRNTGRRWRRSVQKQSSSLCIRLDSMEQMRTSSQVSHDTNQAAGREGAKPIPEVQDMIIRSAGIQTRRSFMRTRLAMVEQYDMSRTSVCSYRGSQPTWSFPGNSISLS